MKCLTLLVCAVLGLALDGSAVRAGGGSPTSGGYQPGGVPSSQLKKALTPEELKLQDFWQNYYQALSRYYGDHDHVDWVAYYKNHGYQISGAYPSGSAVVPVLPPANVTASPGVC
jgi:hypothetical protein